ncbi:MAG: M15 family metallopeptidase [Myxococcales bacterium]|nr:M15 family metallopeptidase [Myxococcales bacterium]
MFPSGRGLIILVLALLAACSGPQKRPPLRPPRVVIVEAIRPRPLGPSPESPRRPTPRHERPIVRLTPELSKQARLSLLDQVHPGLASRGAEFVRRCWQAGLRVRLISAYRAYSPRRIRRTASNKKRRMWASWHNWALALDFSFIGRDGRTESIRRIRRGDKRWNRAGRIAREVGLIWGGDFRSGPDKPHIEWHPGYPSLINYPRLQKLLRASGRHARFYERVWRWFPARRSHRQPE